jgi:hypothetical protein
MAFPKHDSTPKKRTKKPEAAPTEPVKVVVSGPDSSRRTPSMQHDINHVAGLSGVEDSLDCIARGIFHLTGEHSSVCLATGYDTPLKLTLHSNDYDDTMGRLVTAFERIADSVSRLAGLSRPRLESWHEQDEYEPRYKDMVPDGGAPGPKPGV